MGYYIEVISSDVVIKKENFSAALEALKKATKGKSFSWVDDEEVSRATSLEKALIAWRWEPEEHGGDIVSLCFMRDKLGDEETLFSTLAPFVESGSYIHINGEDGEQWKWIFKKGKLTAVDRSAEWGTISQKEAEDRLRVVAEKIHKHTQKKLEISRVIPTHPEYIARLSPPCIGGPYGTGPTPLRAAKSLLKEVKKYVFSG